jgi:GNAT superfamily N-acetyltransferase
MHYRRMTVHETAAVAHLAAHVFSASVAPLFEPVGVAEFLHYLAPHELAKRLHHEHEVWVAESGGKLVGMIEVRDGAHITLFFVDQAYQGQGIGRHLLQHVLESCRQRHPTLTALSVHATPNAVPIYTKLGFHPVAAEQVERGMRYVPMMLSLSEPTQHLSSPKHHAAVHAAKPYA